MSETDSSDKKKRKTEDFGVRATGSWQERTSYLILETQALRDREEGKKTVDKGNRFRKNIWEVISEWEAPGNLMSVSLIRLVVKQKYFPRRTWLTLSGLRTEKILPSSLILKSRWIFAWPVESWSLPGLPQTAAWLCFFWIFYDVISFLS